MSIDKETILEVYKFYGAQDLKQLQTKLTKTANGLLRDTVNSRIAPLFTDKETETLIKAAHILKGFRNKVEHAKEAKAREERRQKAYRDRLDAEGLALANRYFHVEPGDYREMLLICLAVKAGYTDIGRDLTNYLEDQGLSHAVEGSIREYYREAMREIGYRSHDYDHAPDEAVLTQAKARFDESREQIIQKNKTLLDKVSEFFAVKTSDNVTKLPKRPR